jgi:hypothetical protein
MTQWGLDALFNPAKRHMDEEKQRLQSTREEVGDSSGGKRIDLESGKVVIRRNTAVDDATSDDEPSGDEPSGDATDGSSGVGAAAETGAASEPDPTDGDSDSEATASSGA